VELAELPLEALLEGLGALGVLHPVVKANLYRGTSLIRKRPTLGTYSRHMPRVVKANLQRGD